MSADRLERATRALRETTEAPAGALERSLERLERARRARPRPRRALHALAWTLASTFVGVGAWANVTGRVNWFDVAPREEELDPIPLAPAAPLSKPAERASEPPPVEEAPAPEEPEPAEEAPLVVPPKPRAPEPAPVVAAPKPRASEPAIEAAPAPERPAVDPADELYRAAHSVHFEGKDYAEAVAAWDRYLEAARPGHRWLLEARFNRAVALYRLRRFSEAARALEPFAEGDHGGYRRDDARRLLDALSERQ